MGWFDEQIKERKKHDDEALLDAMEEISASVQRKRHSEARNDRSRIKDAVDEILRYYHAKPKEIPDSVTKLEDQLEYQFRPYGIMRRNVKLTKGWYKDATGAFLGYKRTVP